MTRTSDLKFLTESKCHRNAPVRRPRRYAWIEEYMPTFVYAATMEVGERVWMLNVLTRPGFDTSTDRRQRMLVLVAGFLGSFLLFSVVWRYNTRRVALAQAEAWRRNCVRFSRRPLEAFAATDEVSRIETGTARPMRHVRLVAR